jgi:hypothetical protein
MQQSFSYSALSTIRAGLLKNYQYTELHITMHAQSSLVLSYLTLRKAVGIIGISLPFVLVVGTVIIEGSQLLSSISAYYYSVMGDVFVGSLFAIGVFLLSYRGYERIDDIAGDLACVFAIGVALFPTAPSFNANAQEQIIGWTHLIFALCFFLTLAYFSLALFRKTKPNQQPTRQKVIRNRIYVACGSVIVVCIALIVLIKLLPSTVAVQSLSPIFWLEALAIIAFGLSWFVKGEAILADS